MRVLVRLPSYLSVCGPILILTLVYWITGLASLLLAIPPGFVTGIFLPMGISLASLLIWGNRLLPGVVLGSSLLNVTVALKGAEPLSFSDVSVAVQIACGSALACFCGAWLIRRFVGFPNELADERKIFLLFLFGGPVASCVSASVGTAVLLLHNIIPVDQFLVSWGTWWVGDAIGVLIAVPLMCVFFAEPRYFWRDRRVIVALPLVLSSLMIVGIFINASNNEQKKVNVQFAQEASLVAAAVESSLSSVEDVLATLGGLFMASQQVTNSEFHRFVEQVIGEKYGVSGFSWNQLVRAQGRAEFEQSIQAQGFNDFAIREKTDSDYVVAPERDTYVVITYISPWREGQTIQGINVAADAIRANAINRAASSGQFALTKPLHLLQDQVFSPGVIAFYPVFDLEHLDASGAGTQRWLKGYATGIVRTHDLISASLAHFDSNNYRLLITDVTDPQEHLAFYANDQVEARDYDAELALEHNVELGGRQLVIQITPTQQFLTSHLGLQSWYLLVGGLLFCSCLGGFLLLISGRTLHIQNLVQQRTSELAAILKTAAEAILVIQGDGGIEKVNTAAAKLFGYPIAQLRSLRLDDLVPSLIGLSGDRLFDAVKDAGRERLALRNDGVELNVELSMSQVNIEEHAFFTLIIHDITARKKLEQLKAEFISTVSHELRTPLTSIKGALSILAKTAGDKLGESPRQLLTIAEANTDRLARLVNDILDIERLEFGRSNLELRRQPLVPLLQQSLELNLAYAERYEVQLELSLADSAAADNDWWVCVDGDRFIQVMTNLISNAIKFSHPQGRVYITPSGAGDLVNIAVIDQGQGIPDSFKPQIFTKFAQADSSDSRKRDGSGLGLSITKSLVEAMGGSIAFESQQDKGTTFVVSLPLVTAEPTGE